MNKLDILKREEFVDSLINLTENISANKTTTSFAINGVWGCGKSFVLDMFEEKLSLYPSEETATDKYFIIRYNCWKYDYYEEPLIAIVATIIDIIEEKTKLFPDTQENREILGMLKATGISLLSIFNSAIKNKTGVDAKAIYDAYKTVIQGSEEAATEYEKDHSFDIYFGFKKVMDKLHELIGKLSQRYTLVFLVDELDRCMPEYAIKVLERLHHLTEGSSNVITIISMDKKQLSTSITQIFGFENPEEYLKKFISFEVSLDFGDVSERISEKYAEYINLFDKDIFPFEDSIEEYMREIFINIDIRTQEQLIKRAMLAHTLLFSEKKDYSFMCMELLLTVLICFYKNESWLEDKSVAHTTVDKMFGATRNGPQPKFAEYISQHFVLENLQRKQDMIRDSVIYLMPEKNDLYAAIIYTWYWLHNENTSFVIRLRPGTGYDVIKNNPGYLKTFAETIQMIQ